MQCEARAPLPAEYNQTQLAPLSAEYNQANSHRKEQMFHDVLDLVKPSWPLVASVYEQVIPPVGSGPQETATRSRSWLQLDVSFGASWVAPMPQLLATGVAVPRSTVPQRLREFLPNRSADAWVP
mmetsp:Transcript_46968/g.93509  ORF Transcript_46968/g.93509 Transcript_46968/m.93509 type:complete len:125 (-) Transcript_46968:1328-1702(-)